MTIEDGSELADEIIAEMNREKMFKRMLKKRKENEERLKLRDNENICCSR